MYLFSLLCVGSLTLHSRDAVEITPVGGDAERGLVKLDLSEVSVWRVACVQDGDSERSVKG